MTVDEYIKSAPQDVRVKLEELRMVYPAPIVSDFQKELKDFVTATSTVQLRLGQELPLDLIKKMVKARMKVNELAAEKK